MEEDEKETTRIAEQAKERTDPDGGEATLRAVIEAMQVGDVSISAIHDLRQGTAILRDLAETDHPHSEFVRQHIEPHLEKVEKSIELLIEGYARAVVDQKNCTCDFCRREKAGLN